MTGSLEEALRSLARESGRALADLGVRAEDEKWIREHGDTIASLAGRRHRLNLAGFFYRLARRAARTAR